ncbi:hypothetical protein [Subsaximicrobium wynnwilliamsii]|nr:hypothetical protein [Subsaximicrobium wynnwilliamsii]
MKKKYKLIMGIIACLIVFYILSDWAHFKAGLLGKPPIEKVQE